MMISPYPLQVFRLLRRPGSRMTDAPAQPSGGLFSRCWLDNPAYETDAWAGIDGESESIKQFRDNPPGAWPLEVNGFPQVCHTPDMTSSRQAEIDTMLASARRRAGVADAMRVYGRTVERVAIANRVVATVAPQTRSSANVSR